MQTVHELIGLFDFPARKLMALFLDLVKLKMWDSLQFLLTSRNSSDEIKVQTLWIIGTAVQNNPSAQNSVGLPS